MACHFPRRGFRTVYQQRFDAQGRPVDEDLMAGPVCFSEESARRKGLEVVSDQPVPCGRCQGCLSARACDRTTRLIHEGQGWQRNCVVTLTYDDAHLPVGRTLVKKDLQDFMMRLRNRARRHDGVECVRFEGIGEYGKQTLRPHYHVILFNYEFPDCQWWSGKGDAAQFTSRVLEEDVWTKGHCRVGRFSQASAAYVAGYITEKQIGDPCHEQYWRRAADGSRYQVLPEFALGSRRPGIGDAWLKVYEADVYPHGYVVLRSGSKVRPPPFYDAKYKARHPLEFRDLAARREVDAISKAADNTPERLAVKEQVLRARLSQKARDVL